MILLMEMALLTATISLITLAVISFGHIGLAGRIVHNGLIGFIGLGLIGFMIGLCFVSLIRQISLIYLLALLNHWPFGCTRPNSFNSVSGLIGQISLVGQISIISLSGISGISGLISHNGLVHFIGLCLIGFIGLGLVSLVRLIFHTIGLIGLNSLSLIGSGMNWNATFAPLGAGGGHQNSGNAGSLQPTTSLNLGTNVGLVGKFGAEKAAQYSLAIIRVLSSGTGKMAGAPLTINYLL